MLTAELEFWTVRAVLDTNTWISAILFPASLPGQVLKKVRTHGRILASQKTLEELALVITRSKFDRYLSLQERLSAVGRARRLVELVTITANVISCRDPKDNKFLELAVSGRADVIVTGDADLLVLDPFQGIKIVTARRFIAE